MDCQSGCTLKALITAYFRGVNLRSACPALGSASMWAEARRIRIANMVALQRHTVGLNWPIACKL